MGSFVSDVCKHCEHAGCLEACPTGSIMRTEFGGVFIQPDVCNGCGYCVVTCPFGVVDRRPDDGRAFKCTFCYDRQKDGLMPACAKACPTESILFGEIEACARARRARVGTAPSRHDRRATVRCARDVGRAAHTPSSSSTGSSRVTTCRRLPRPDDPPQSGVVVGRGGRGRVHACRDGARLSRSGA